MEHAFWHKKWEQAELGFHQSEVHPFLVEFLPKFSLREGAHIFVPLCGKSLDMRWLLDQGFNIVGSELSETAIIAFFETLGVEPKVEKDGDHTRYFADRLDIFVGDIFALTPEQLGQVDFIYDRAALIALPDDMASRYAAHLIAVSDKAQQMLIGFEYHQAAMDGPPFALSEGTVQAYYSETYAVTELGRRDLEGGLKGQVPATEIVRALHVR